MKEMRILSFVAGTGPVFCKRIEKLCNLIGIVIDIGGEIIEDEDIEFWGAVLVPYSHCSCKTETSGLMRRRVRLRLWSVSSRLRRVRKRLKIMVRRVAIAIRRAAKAK